MQQELWGRRYKNASGRETYEIFHAEPDFLKTIALILQAQFGFRQKGQTLVGLDVVYMNFTKCHVAVVLGWDNWTGCSIFSECPGGDEQIIAIGNYLDEALKFL